ncbi:aminotransferase [Hyaloraphidium curvatum]|nr:aminotransferase [Hyaloraphidium curvatum]
MLSAAVRHPPLGALARAFHASAPRLQAAPALAELSSKGLSVTSAPVGKPLVPLKDLVFGKTFTDHMLSVEWTAEKGWLPARIHPYEKLHFDPSAIVLHYGLACFEGMKAYKDKAGNIRLFRPQMNMQRLWKSAHRLALPTFDQKALLELLEDLLKVDEKWIPNERGYSVYIRPTIIGTQESLGVGASNRALLFVILSPVGPYYKSGFAAVSLKATNEYTRAWPGGTGDAKIGANYAPGIRPQIEAGKEGYSQNLWLFGKEDFITEAGTMNFFALLTNEKGEKELVTPPLDGTILPGVTRDSMLTLARDWKEFKVSERPITMAELSKAADEGRLHEAFGAGTAAIVAPIKAIKYKGRDIPVPLDPSNPASQAGPLALRFADTIMAVQYGEKEYRDWSVVVK